MAYYTQNGAQVFVTPTQIANPGVYHTAPVAAYPQTYPVYQQHPPAPSKYGASFSSASSMWLGAFLVCSGAASLVGAGLAFRYYALYSELGTGLWCGAMFLSAGAVGIAAGQHRTDSLIKGTTATGVLSVVFGIAQLTMASLGLDHDLQGYSCYNVIGCTDSRCACYWYDWEEYAIAANGLLIGAAAFAIIFGFWIFIIGCNALCCSKALAEIIPVQVQLLQSPPQHGPYEGTPAQQMFSVPVQLQYMQNPQQVVAPNHQPLVIALRATQAKEDDEAPKYEELEREHL